MNPAEMEKAARGMAPPAAFENKLTTDSSTGHTPRALRATASLAVLRETAIAEQLFGLDPATKAQAAAHEAGHIIVAHVAGSLVTGARLFDESDHGRKVWGGITYHTAPNPRGRQRNGETGFTTVAAAPVCAFRSAIIYAAGFAGEVLAGLDHPASSLDERSMARRICAELDRVLNMADGTNLHLLGTILDKALGDHPAQFAAIRTHLERYRRLTRNEADRMLANVKPVALAALLMRGVR